MKGKVFILEDDPSICGLIKVTLEMNDLDFRAFGTVREFTDVLTVERPDVALLNIMLPDGSGLDVLKLIKSRYPEVSCIMLSALGKEEDKVGGLNMGADDYVSKPFSVIELAARINARLRSRPKQTVFKVDNIILDTESREVLLNGKKLDLNKKEFDLLKYFMENKGKVLTRDKLLGNVWDYSGVESRTLDNHVARLRKMGVEIETIFGVGYKL